MDKRYWTDGVNQIIRKVLNGKRTIQEAKEYMDKYYTGNDNKRSFNHKAFETTSGDTTAELKVYNMLKDAIKLGHGKDYNFEIVFR